MPPKKRGREAPFLNSSSRSDAQNRKPDPSLPTRQAASVIPSPASGANPPDRDFPAGPTTQSLSGPSAMKAVQKVEAPSPTAGHPAVAKEQTPLMPPTVGPQAESAGGKSILKKKIVKRVVRKVKKPCPTGGTEPKLADTSSNMKMEVEKENPTADRIIVPDSKPSLPTSRAKAVAGETPVVPTEVLTTTRESLTSGVEKNSEKSSEAMDSGVVKEKVKKKVIRKVMKKKIVKKMVPKGTLASKRAEEAALGLAEEQGKSGDAETNKAGEEKKKSIVQGVNPSHSTKHNEEEIGLKIGENKGNKDEKKNKGVGNSRENPSSDSGVKKKEEGSKDAITKIEGDKEHKNKISCDSGNMKEIKKAEDGSNGTTVRIEWDDDNNNKVSGDSGNKEEINGEIKVCDEIQKEKVDSSSSKERKVRKVIKKKIVKKLVPKGTLSAKRTAEENLNVAAESQVHNCNPKSEETLTLANKSLNQKASSSSETEPEQARSKELAVSNKGSATGENPKNSSNAETQKGNEMEELRERQKIKPTKPPTKEPAKGTVILGEKLKAEYPGPNTEEEKTQQGSVTTLADEMSQKPNSTMDASAEVKDGLTERQRRRQTEIFIGGLDKEVREMDIRTVFEKAGEIVEVRMFMDNNTGKNKGYCFLRYKEPTQAKKALSMFSKVEIRGKRCGASAVEDHDSIYIGNIDKRWKKEEVTKMLEDFGIEKIDTVTLMPDLNNPEWNRGFAFLELETNRDAQIAYKKLKAADFTKGGPVKIDWAEPWYEPDQEEMLKVKSVFVECIPSFWDKAEISEIFKKFGEIERVVLARDIPSAKRKDYAFVNYTSREAAISCIELIEKDGLVENGSKVNIKVSLAKPLSRGKPTKGGGRPSASERKKQKMLQSAQSSASDNLRVLKEPPPPQENSNPKGKTFENYGHGLHGEKRGFSAVSNNPVYSDVRGHPRPRYDSSYYSSYGSSNSSLSYDGRQLYGIQEPSPYHQSPNFGYTGGSYHGRPSYYPDASETKERVIPPPGQGSWPYPKY